MSDRKVVVKSFVHKEEPSKQVQVFLTYDLGGMNWAASRTQARGYYAHVQPVRIDGHFTVSMGRSGVYALLEEASRFSSNNFERVANSIRRGHYFVEQLIDKVFNNDDKLNKEDYELVTF